MFCWWIPLSCENHCNQMFRPFDCLQWRKVENWMRWADLIPGSAGAVDGAGEEAVTPVHQHTVTTTEQELVPAVNRLKHLPRNLSVYNNGYPDQGPQYRLTDSLPAIFLHTSELDKGRKMCVFLTVPLCISGNFAVYKNKTRRCGSRSATCRPHRSVSVSLFYGFNITQKHLWIDFIFRVSNPHWFNSDPDLDPAFFLIADPDPGFWWSKF